jgi:hypothetical protein
VKAGTTRCKSQMRWVGKLESLLLILVMLMLALHLVGRLHGTWE